MRERARRWARRLRDPNPVFVRELRESLRSRRFRRLLVVATALLGLGTLAGAGLLASDPSLGRAAIGRGIYHLFFSGALLLVCVAAPIVASTAVSREREDGTWDLVLLTRLGPERIVTGKFLALFTSMSLVLVSVAPVVGISMLFGDVGPGHLVVGFAVLGLVLATGVGFGITVSAFASSTSRAIVITTLTYVPAALLIALVSTLVGVADTGSLQGPFWFADRVLAPSGVAAVGALVLFPLYGFAAFLWSTYHIAVAAVRDPQLRDRHGRGEVFAPDPFGEPG